MQEFGAHIFVVSIVLRISGTRFKSFTTKFNLWLAQWKYNASVYYFRKIDCTPLSLPDIVAQPS